MTKNDTHMQDPAAPKAEQSVQGAVRRSAPDPAKYYHGRPCRRAGHTLRLKSSRACVECQRADLREYKRNKRRADPEWVERENGRERERRRERRQTDPEYRERVNKRKRDWYAEKCKDPEWAERERQRLYENGQRWYAGLDHITYYKRQLDTRRWAALKRKEARHNGSLSDEG